MRPALPALAVCAIASSAFAEDASFGTSINFKDYGSFRGIAAAANGDVWLAGGQGSASQQHWEGWLVRVSAEGKVLQDGTISRGKNVRNVFNAAALDGKNALWLAGYTSETKGSKADGWIVYLPPEGDGWQKPFGRAGFDDLRDVVAAPDGGAYAVGSMKVDENFQAWIMRLDEDGEVLWEKSLGGDKAELANAVALAKEGGIWVAGRTDSKGEGRGDLWILRIDADGAVLWDQTYGGEQQDFAADIFEAVDGGVWVSGETASKGAGNPDIWVLRIGAEGQLLWDKTFGTPGFEAANGLTTDVADGAWVTSSQNNDVRVLRFGANGDVEFDESFGGPALRERPNDMLTLPDGTVWIAGEKGLSSPDGWFARMKDGKPLP